MEGVRDRRPCFIKLRILTRNTYRMAQGTLSKLAAIICCKGDSSTSRTPCDIIWEKVFRFDGRTVHAIAVVIADDRAIDVPDYDEEMYKNRQDDYKSLIRVCASDTSVLNDSLETSTAMSLNAEGQINRLIDEDWKRVIRDRETKRILGDWEVFKIKEVEVEKKDIDSSITTVKNEVYQLGGLYTVFIGVLFTAVSTSSKLECRHIWSPIVLCCMGFLMMAFIAHKKFKFLEDTHVTRTLPNFLQRKVISCCVNKAEALKAKLFAPGDNTSLEADVGILDGEIRLAELYLKFLSQQVLLDESDPARLTWPVGSLECPEGAKPVDRAPRKIVITILAAATAVLVVSFVHILCL